MNTPVPALMKQYSTEDIFLAKTAGAVPILARLTMAALNLGLAESHQKADQEQRREDAVRTEAVREHELGRIQPANDNLRHTRAPMILPAGSDVPVGFDEGMVRLASIAALTGADMAKEAGIGDFMTMAKTLGTKALGGIGGALKGVGAAAPAATSAVPAAGGLLQKGKQLLGGGMGLKTNLALAGGTLAAGVLASKAVRGGARAMGRESAGLPVYGTPTHGVGYQLPFGVNQWGQPQVGTALG